MPEETDRYIVPELERYNCPRGHGMVPLFLGFAKFCPYCFEQWAVAQWPLDDSPEEKPEP